MIGGYILINGEILMQIDSDDPDNPTIISEEDYYKIYNVVKLGKEIRVEYNGIVTPVIASNYDDDFCALTFAETAHGSVFLYTIMISVTVDDTDPDNPVYAYSGIMKEAEVGGSGGGIYQHIIKMKTTTSYTDYEIIFYLILPNSEPFTPDTLIDYVKTHGYAEHSYDKVLPVQGKIDNSSSGDNYYFRIPLAIQWQSSATQLQIWQETANITAPSLSNSIVNKEIKSTMALFTDTVIELV